MLIFKDATRDLYSGRSSRGGIILLLMWVWVHWIIIMVVPVNSRHFTEGPRSFVAFIYSDKIIDRTTNGLPPPCRNCHDKIKIPFEINRIDLIFASFEQGLSIKLSYGYGNMKKYMYFIVLVFFSAW